MFEVQSAIVKNTHTQWLYIISPPVAGWWTLWLRPNRDPCTCDGHHYLMLWGIKDVGLVLVDLDDTTLSTMSQSTANSSDKNAECLSPTVWDMYCAFFPSPQHTGDNSWEWSEHRKSGDQHWKSDAFSHYPNPSTVIMFPPATLRDSTYCQPYAVSTQLKSPRQFPMVKHGPNNAQGQSQWMRRRNRRRQGSRWILYNISRKYNAPMK